MKKRITLIVTCTMAILLAACGAETGTESPTLTPTTGAKPTESAAATETPSVEPTATSTPTPEPTATSTPTPEPTATSTPTPEPTATTAPRLEDTYAKGTVTETGFESEWMNLRFTTQAGVYMYTQEQLDEVMRQGVEFTYGENAETILDYVELTTVTEMMAQYISGANVIIQTERLPVLYNNMTAEEYLTAVIENLGNSEAKPEVATDEEFYAVEIGGEEYTGMSVALDYGTGEAIYQEYFVRRKESRMIGIIATYTEASMEDAKNLVSVFGSYNSEPIILPEPTPYPSTYEPGILTESSFESEWLNLRFTATDEVTMRTREEIADTLPFGAAVIYGDDAEARVESSQETLYIEMMAVHNSEGSVLVQTEVLPVGYEAASAEVYLATLMNDLKNAANVTYTVDEEIYETEIVGESYLGFSSSVEVLGETLYQEIVCRKKENRMISMIISYEKDTMENAQYLLTLFGTYDSEPVVVPEPTAAPTDVPTEAPAVSEAGFNAGTWNGSVYENQWLGFKFTVPEGAEFSASDSADTVSIETTWPEGLPIVQIMVEEMVFEGMSAEEYAEALKLALADSGITYTFDENLYVVEIAGQEYLNLASTAETMGVQLYQDYCLRELDGYVVAIIITYADGYESYLQSVLDAFSAY